MGADILGRPRYAYSLRKNCACSEGEIGCTTTAVVLCRVGVYV